jgi:hypothetical protein
MGNKTQKINIPENFGDHQGVEIENKQTLLSEIDHQLNVNKPPSIEYIFVEPASMMTLIGNFGVNFLNPYGHSAIRYNLKGKEYLMNIQIPKDETEHMLNFIDPKEYFFGTKYDLPGNVQRGFFSKF